MPTCVTPCSWSHFAKPIRSCVIVPKLVCSRRLCSEPSQIEMHAAIFFLCTSRPHTRRYTISIVSSLGVARGRLAYRDSASRACSRRLQLAVPIAPRSNCYERAPRFGGGVYRPILRRLETFTDEPLRAALKVHEKRAGMVLDLEEKVATVVRKLRERGLVSPYLRSFVVARINPLRWIAGEPPPLEDLLRTMRDRATRFNVEKIRPKDLAAAAGPPDDEM